MSHKLKLSLREVADITGESLPLIHDAITAGDLKTFVVGRRRFARPAAARTGPSGTYVDGPSFTHVWFAAVPIGVSSRVKCVAGEPFPLLCQCAAS
jgi:hypothetical protein